MDYVMVRPWFIDCRRRHSDKSSDVHQFAENSSGKVIALKPHSPLQSDGISEERARCLMYLCTAEYVYCMRVHPQLIKVFTENASHEHVHFTSETLTRSKQCVMN